MYRKILVVSLVLLLIVLGHTVQAQEEGEIRYGVIVTRPDWLYLAPSEQAEKWENILLYQSLGPNDRLSDLSTIMAGDQYRMRLFGDWIQILPDEGATDPFTHELNTHVYLPASQIRLLEQEEFAPISLGNSPASTKLILIIRDETPDMVVFDEVDGELQVVLRTPIFVGRGDPSASLTQLGDFRVYLTKAADNMTSFTGVPWTMYFTGDRALHEFHGWNWGYLTQGGYGSQGCVNVPDGQWFTIEVEGQRISAAHWLYRWVSNVPTLDYDEFDSAQSQAFLDSNDPGWYSATTTIRVLVVSSFWDIYSAPAPARLDSNSAFASWAPYEDAYLQIQGTWVLPHITGGNFTPEFVPQETIPANPNST